MAQQTNIFPLKEIALQQRNGDFYAYVPRCCKQEQLAVKIWWEEWIREL
jgi:hypothetical protein